MAGQDGGESGNRKGRRGGGPARPRAPGAKTPGAKTPGAAAGAGERAAPKVGPPRQSETRGFRHAAAIADAPIRGALNRRGFAEAKVLTDWDRIAGPELAGVCRPMKVTYAAGGFGATMILWAAPGRGPELQMQAPKIIERVNAFYGYRAISRIKVSQTARGARASGPAGGGISSASRSRDPGGMRRGPDCAISEPEETKRVARRAEAMAADVESPELRAALARLGRNVIGRARTPRGKASRKDDSE